ncbi:elongation factor P hydroxylase [Psychrobacter lutiphocae]|uniref:elongation factor P hydroxylase n=1 Tax=Psychrobacter lutiphocae TaxID=540500 RepID=UPI000370D79B|nr:elongation factor P hydroxylase [Psychrobacter lutiphocae]
MLTSNDTTPNFIDLPIKKLQKVLLQQANTSISQQHEQLIQLKQQWQHTIEIQRHAQVSLESIEAQQVEWLITLFNLLFADQNVILARGLHEPEYFPAEADKQQPARIEFAHGFFQSALHEISHWSIAGAHRRTLPDFGYWYAPDGRTEAQQHAFEKVEIKPQAIECLFSLMCGRRFNVSQDNLHANFDTSQSTFAVDVFAQTKHYIQHPETIPKDARTLLTALAYVCHDTLTES